MKRIGFTGTRDLQLISDERKKGIINFFIDLLDKHVDRDITIIHGGARGVDTYIHDIALVHDLNVEIYPAHNSPLANEEKYVMALPKNPLSRNKDIVDNSDLIVAVPIDPENEELRSGTWATVRYARKLNREIIFL